MAFYCPRCSTSGSLRLTRSLELPADSRSDEITLQIVRCVRCGFEALAIYEESRRGRFGDESIDHRGYDITASDLKIIKKNMSHCPNPRDSKCRCPVHRQLGSRDKSGRWNGLTGIELRERFDMDRR